MRAKAGDHSQYGKKRRANNGSSRGEHRGATEKLGFSSLTTSKGSRLFQITCYVPTPSPNEWVRAHWNVYYKIKSAWLRRLHNATIHHWGLGKFGKPIEKVALRIERRGIRKLDDDNVAGGMKPVIDGLVHLGFLSDDTPDVIIKPHYFQTIVSTQSAQRTVITIEEQ